MTKNMGTADRVIPSVAALAVFALYLGGLINGTLALVLLVFAVAFLLMSAAAWCPVYAPLGISSRRPWVLSWMTSNLSRASTQHGSLDWRIEQLAGLIVAGGGFRSSALQDARN
jgi:hypothetical protein